MPSTNLPPEVLLEIGLYLSQKDLTRCVLVNKAWHNAINDLIWHSVDISDYDSCSDVFYSFMGAYSSWPQYQPVSDGDGNSENVQDQPTDPTPSLESLLQRNIYRIRVLNVQYSSVLDLFYQGPPSSPSPSLENTDTHDKETTQGGPQGGSPDITRSNLPPLLHLTELQVDLTGDPSLKAYSHRLAPRTLLGVRPLCPTRPLPPPPGYGPPPGFRPPPPVFSPPPPGFPTGFPPSVIRPPIPSALQAFLPPGFRPPVPNFVGAPPGHGFSGPPAALVTGIRPLTTGGSTLPPLLPPADPQLPTNTAAVSTITIPITTSTSVASIARTGTTSLAIEASTSTALNHPSLTAPLPTDSASSSVVPATVVPDPIGVTVNAIPPLTLRKPYTSISRKPFLRLNNRIFTPVNARALLQILDRSRKNLKRLILSMANLALRGTIEDQVRVLVAALQSCQALEELKIQGFENGVEGYHVRWPSDWNIKEDKWKEIQDWITQLVLPGPAPAPKTGTVLSQLRVLSIVGPRPDIKILHAILQHQKKKGYIHSLLEELNLFIKAPIYLEDETFSLFISRCAGPKGWKTLGLQDCAGALGPWTMKSVLEHATTLENLRLVNCEGFSSEWIQALLSMAPNLKRFDALPTFAPRGQRFEYYFLMASDILKSKWVCEGLRSFKCMIGGIPKAGLRQWPQFPPPVRPGLQPIVSPPTFPPLFPYLPHQETGPQDDNDNWPCANWTPGWRTMRTIPEKSRAIEHQILERQFSRLQDLVELSFGMDNYDNGKEFIAPEDIDPDDHLPFPDRLFQGLTLDLAGGLDHLQDLNRLQRVRSTRKGRSTLSGEEEMLWIQRHWPAFDVNTAVVHNVEKYKDRFWTDRGFGMSYDTRSHYEDLLTESGIPDENMPKYFDYDWW
ncbi:hypothetical protein EMPS_07326 [Entomortierella parvispora]|uniref:F-box domain-containing protein n=1 Tax=Entomortierella parvispora TaxID=205924 RepID=A0A9P3HED2_9FUNG|nr:hypothetical protein EMPS_07326 [Entomortierella parvispora]